ncbi:uncharacterized protein LOC141656947 [Silene latifolia]|uniref:uncharacterized protein LOC141656947 n=1 Tax=Silene latifolia TaxID=37657 RepID=UPI003D77F146
MDDIIRKLVHDAMVLSFYRSLIALPSVRGKTLAWVQLLLVDEQQTAQLKLHALGPKVANPDDDSDVVTDDDSNVVERSRKLFKAAAPFFMNDFGLWIFSRSMVRKENDGSIDAAAQPAREFSQYDPLESLSQVPINPSSGIRCAEIFLFFAIDGNFPGDLCNRDALLDFLNSLNSGDGIRKLHAFTVVAGCVEATRKKLRELKGSHLTA